MTSSDDAILARLREVLTDEFEIEPTRVSGEVRLYEDLDLDSIDAVDLIDHLRNTTGKPIQAEAFRDARTIEDVVAILRAL